MYRIPLTVAATPSGFGGAQQRRAAAGIPSLRVEYRVPQCRAAAHSHRLTGPRRCLEVLFYSQVLTHRKLDSIYFGSFRNVKYFLVDLWMQGQYHIKLRTNWIEHVWLIFNLLFGWPLTCLRFLMHVYRTALRAFMHLQGLMHPVVADFCCNLENVWYKMHVLDILLLSYLSIFR